MELYVSSWRGWRPGYGSPVSISLSCPRWLPWASSAPRLWAATPRPAYFRSSDEDFAAAYAAQLDEYGAQAISRKLTEIAATAFEAPSDRLCLLCWEADPARCHRSQFASWLLVTTGEKCTEAGTGPARPKGVPQ